ncbi:hypothetical protein AALP_AA6G325700 [Arabis alpina]|uniref:Uncharacterized protein n=1 Tax=Arabis alpina TaxID=50452 RepID=A0A087GT64_ARAAL|nr:hypothetical protein AALP_AA6G325700 [Arabis alpina]
MMSQNEGGYPVDYSTITNLFLQCSSFLQLSPRRSSKAATYLG